MASAIDNLLQKLVGQYQVLVFFIIISNIFHVYVSQHLLHHYLWTPGHHCKVPKPWKEREALPSKFDILGRNASRAFLHPDSTSTNPVYVSSNIFQTDKGSVDRWGTKATLNVVAKPSINQGKVPWHQPFQLQNQTILVWKDLSKMSTTTKPQEEKHSRTIRSNGLAGNEEETEFASCEMYVVPRSPRNGTKPCTHGYYYNLQSSEWTITAEWNLVCKNAKLRPRMKIFIAAGSMAGGFIFGPLTDRIGRRAIILLSLAGMGGIGVSLYFVNQFITFFIMKCLQAVFSQGLHISCWTLLAEMFPPKWRCRSLMVAGAVVPLGSLLAGVAALNLGHWRAIQLASSLPVIASLFYSCLLPESLRWLLIRGKIVHAHEAIRRVSGMNVIPYSHASYSDLKDLSLHLCKHESSFNVCKSCCSFLQAPQLRKHLLIISFLWFATATSLHILESDARVTEEVSYHASLRNDNIKHIVESSVQLGGVAVAMMLSSLFYRRSLLMLLYLIPSALNLALVIPHMFSEEGKMAIPIVFIILRMCCLLAISGSRAVLQVILSEVSPTTLRAFAMGICVSVFALGDITSHFVLQLGDLTYVIVPWVLCSVFCLIGALLIFLLPETSGIDLPDIVEESENIGFRGKGDIIKSDNDPTYSRTIRPLNVNDLIINYPGDYSAERLNRIFQIGNTENQIQSPASTIANNSYPRSGGFSHANRMLRSTYPEFKQNKYHSRTLRSSSSTLSTSSCSVYSSSSFFDVNIDTYNAIGPLFIPKKNKSGTKSLTNCWISNKSDKLKFPDLELEDSGTTSENDKNDHWPISNGGNMPHCSKAKSNIYSRSEKSVSREKLTDIAEESEVTIEKGKSNKSSKYKNGISELKSNLTLDNGCTSTSLSNESSITTEPPKVISTVLKNDKILEDDDIGIEKKNNMEICTFQSNITKSTNSSTGMKNTKYNDDINIVTDMTPISQNKKLQSLASKSVHRTNSKLPLPRTNPTNKHPQLSNPENKSNLLRKNSSFEVSRPNYRLRMDNGRPKTQSFIIPRRPQMGKLVSVKIERFESSAGSSQHDMPTSKIPVLSSSSLRKNTPTGEQSVISPIYSQCKKVKPSVLERVKHFENNESILGKGSGATSINPEDINMKGNNKKSGESLTVDIPTPKIEFSTETVDNDKVVFPKSTIEPNDKDEIYF